ncbi:MAG: OTU domain-containing protein, partial [Gammaproteobacteria bacterium]
MPVSIVQMNLSAQDAMPIEVFRKNFIQAFRLTVAKIQTTEPFATYCEESGSTMMCAMVYKNEETKTTDIELANLGNAEAILVYVNYEQKKFNIQTLNAVYTHNTVNDGIDVLYKYPESKGQFNGLAITRSIGDFNAGTIKEPWFAERSYEHMGYHCFIILKQPGSSETANTPNYKAVQQKVNQGERITAADFNMTNVIDVDSIPKGQIAVSMICEGHGTNGEAIAQKAISLLPALMQNLIAPVTNAVFAKQKQREQQVQISMVLNELSTFHSRLVVLPMITFDELCADRLALLSNKQQFEIIKKYIKKIAEKHHEKGYIFYKFYESSYHQLKQYLDTAINNINDKDNLILLMSALKSFTRRALIWGVWGDIKFGQWPPTQKPDEVYEKLRKARGEDDVNRLLPGTKKLSIEHRLNDDQINQYINSLIKKSPLPFKFALLNSLYLDQNKIFHVKDMRNNINNLVRAQIIIWPFCINNHFGLLLIEKGESTKVTLINGLNDHGFTSDEVFIKHRVNTLVQELSEYPNNTHPRWQKNISFARLNIPPQADAHNCGVAICYAVSLLVNNNEVSFQDTETPYNYTPFRMEIAKEIASTITADKKRVHWQNNNNDNDIPVEVPNNNAKKIKHDDAGSMLNISIIDDLPMDIPLPEGMILGTAVTNGDCLFDSIAQLINDGRTATDMRQLAVNYMRNPENVDKFAPFMGGIEALNSRITQMDNTLEYADQFEVMALAFALKKQIIIISNHITMPPVGNPQDSILYLNHYHNTDSQTGKQGGHYAPIRLANNDQENAIAIELGRRNDIAAAAGA